MFASPDEPLLLASVQSELLVLGVHSSSLHLLSSASRPVFSLDYHWAQQRVYWLSPDYQSIRWADMKNSSNRGTLIKGNVMRFRGKDDLNVMRDRRAHVRSCYRREVGLHRGGLGW